MSRSRSASRKFREQVMTEFAFLLTEFGFKEARTSTPREDFIVRLVNPTTRIVVEGIHWGGSARVAFGAAAGQFENFDLLDLASIRCPDAVPTEAGTLPGQPERLKVLATILRKCGEDVLRGNFSVASKIRALQQRRLEEWEKREADRTERLNRHRKVARAGPRFDPAE